MINAWKPATVTVILASCVLAACNQVKRPNILLVCVDTLRADHMSLFGYERETTPFLDSLARRHTYFSRAYSQATFTLPSHWSMFTSLLPSQHGIFHNAKYYTEHAVSSDHLTTLADALQLTYKTYALADGPYFKPHFGLDKGFEQFDYRGRPLDKKMDDVWEIMNSSPEPYFIFLHTFDVHDWWSTWKKHPAVYRDPDYVPPKKLVKALKWDMPQAGVDFCVAVYDEGIRRTDENLRKLLEPYTEQIESGELVVMIVSDHGHNFWELRKPGVPGHHGGPPYEEQAHVPLIITTPGGCRDEIVAAGIDVAPTLLELAQVEIPPTMEGWSLLERHGDRVVISEALNAGDSMSTRSTRLTHIMNHGQLEVYAGSDTTQTRNLLGTEQHPEKRIERETEEQLRALGYLK